MLVLFISDFCAHPYLSVLFFFLLFFRGYNCCFGRCPVITNVGSRNEKWTAMANESSQFPRVNEHHKFEISFII